MKTLRIIALSVAALSPLTAWSQAAAPQPVGNDTIVLRAGDFALTRAEYEKLVIGFDRASGAPTTGSGQQSVQTGKEVARVLAAVSDAQKRKLDQDAKVQALIKVRGYVMLANAELLALEAEMKKDEAGTRALWNSEKNNYVGIHARQILIRYQGVSAEKPGMKGATRTEAQAKALAADLYQKLKKGADFATVAKASSDDDATKKNGGDMPTFSRGAMVNEFETVAFATPVGSVSEPFKTKYGYHIIEVVERQPYPFENVRASLENIRARQKYEEIVGKGVELNDAYFKP